MTQAAFAATKLEGILDMSNLKDLYEEDLGNTFTNIFFQPPMVTTGVRIPIQGINVSANLYKHLVVASRSTRHYESFGLDLKPAMMNW